MNSRNRKANPNSPLYQAILTLKTPEECYNFFMDLCTVQELNAMEQRFEVAQLLNPGHDLQQDSGAHRRQQRHHQPGKPLFELRHGRLPAGH